MTTDIYLVCTLLGGDWAGIGHSASHSHGQEKTGGFLQHIWQIDHIWKENLGLFLKGRFQVIFLQGSFSIWAISQSWMMMKWEKVWRVAPLGSWWLIDLRLFHKLGFPQRSSFTQFKFIKISLFLASLTLDRGDLGEMQQDRGDLEEMQQK